MKRVLLFLALAGGGLALLGRLGGGFFGQSVQAPAPVVPEVARPPHSSNDSSVDLSEVLGGGMAGGARSAPIQIAPTTLYDRTFDLPPTTWVDPVTHEAVELAVAPRCWVRFDEPAPMRDTAGSPGMRWKGVQIVVYRAPKTYTRAEVDALRANSKTGRRGLERFEITAEEGFETTTPLLTTPGDKTPRERTVIRLTKNVVIRDVIQKLVVRTSDVVVDREAGTAEGTSPIEAQGPGYVARGKGFRLDSTAERLEILEGTEFDAQDLVVDRKAATPAVGANTMKPRHVAAKGATLIVNHGAEKEPWTDVRMDGGVHVELDGGGRLDGESISLRVADRPGAKPVSAIDAANGFGGRRRLERMTAEGDVRYEGRDTGGALLTASGPRLVAEFPTTGVSSLLLTGRSLVTWRGELAFPGERPSDRIVRASATESLLFGPSDESPEEAVVDLVGAARVECGRLPVDTVPQRIGADRITLHLKRRALPPAPLAPTTTPDPGRRPAKSEWLATSFAATGGVSLEGPRLSGAAREIKGFDLDQPAYRVSAVGPDSHLEISDDPEPRPTRAGARGGAAASPAAGAATPSGPARTWMLDRLVARTNAMGSFRVRAGEGAATFAGDTLTFDRATGAEIREKPGKDARVTLEGRESRDRTVEAPAIFLRASDGERVLETQGRTHAVFWVGDDDGASAPPAPAATAKRVVELRSPTRIDIGGSRGGGDADATLTVSLLDGGSLSARTGGVLTDRLTATTIELALVETLPRPGDLGFALAGPRETAAPGAKPRDPAKPAPAAPRPTTAATPGRFVVDSDGLTLVVGTEAKAGSAGGLRRVRAEGHVDARGDDPKEGARRFEGERFDYDAATSLGVLTGATKRARVTLGHEPAVQRVLSPRIEVAFRDGRLARARFAAPVNGVFHTKPEGATTPVGELERYILEDEGGPMTIEGNTVLLEGTTGKPVRIQRSTLSPAGKDTGTPVWITTPRLSITSTSALGTPGSSLASLEANGPGTFVDYGADPKTRSRIVGDTIRLEKPAGAPKSSKGTLHVTSSKGVVLLSRPGSTVEAYDVTYDLETGLPSGRFKTVTTATAPAK